MNVSYQKVIEDRSIPEPNSGCWLWLGGISNGYGWIRQGCGARDRAHRVAWLAYRCGIPSGMYVCHRCDNRLCVNPDHLFLGSPAENNHDMMRKSRNRPPRTHGSAHGRSKLNEAAVMAILQSPVSAGKLSRVYGVSDNVICRIRRGLLWRHVQRPSHGDTSA